MQQAGDWLVLDARTDVLVEALEGRRWHAQTPEQAD